MVVRIRGRSIRLIMKKIILASSSPRRREILKKTGLPFMVDESGYDEDMNSQAEPRSLALKHSAGKARAVALRHKDALIISADTLVVLNGRIFGKPRNKKEAKDMLRALSGKAHTVITAYTILETATGRTLSRMVESRVFFKKLSDGEIATYVKSGEPLDKAGAYGVQGLGAVIVKRIEGDFFNVIGLPLHSLVQSLVKFGITVL